MNILIATDSFKESLSSRQAGEAIRRGILMESAEYKVRVVSIADGGEGTVEALMGACGGELIHVRVYDPLMREIKASYAILGDSKTAVIEMAKASGLELLSAEERNPRVTTTFGTGQLMLDALKRGCKRLILAIGGSATNDAGAGMAQALGVKLLDKNKKPIGFGGGFLSNVQYINVGSVDKRVKATEIIVACDVTNPLTGTNGASHVFGLQKGADASMARELDRNLKHFADRIKEELGIEIESVPGAGAAGGLGGGLLAFTNASLEPGFDIVRRETGFDEQIAWADLIITGEGKMDAQTRYGKTPMGVAGAAKQFGKPVIAIAGTLGEGYQDLYAYGFDAISSIIDKPMLLNEAIITAPQLLERCARSVIRLWNAVDR
jgi:glycerate kinase